MAELHSWSMTPCPESQITCCGDFWAEPALGTENAAVESFNRNPQDIAEKIDNILGSSVAFSTMSGGERVGLRMHDAGRRDLRLPLRTPLRRIVSAWVLEAVSYGSRLNDRIVTL